ncbi:MAG: transporter [Acidobacteriia bacterium]|nr:transporter [Terriglobia bacterium]
MSKLTVALLFATAAAPLALGQNKPVTNCTSRASLICAIPNLYGPNGLILSDVVLSGGVPHLPHFNGDFQSSFSPLGSAIGTELTLLPLASPASGFTYSFEQSTGVVTKVQQSFGPILAERAETIGKGKFFLGFTYQYFDFDSLDGIDLKNIPAVFTHDDAHATGFFSDFITTQNSVHLFVNQETAFATYGLTRRIDVSLALPILSVRLTGNSSAAIHWTNAGADPSSEVHQFPNGSQANGYAISQTASGIGDATVRIKAAVAHGEKASLGFAADVRFPTGDAENFLGSGTYGIKPFVIASLREGKWAPHVNIGYQINGSSILAGNFAGYNAGSTTSPLAPTKGHLPNDLFYTLGTDVGVARRLTLSFDFLGQSVYGAPILVQGAPFTPLQPEITPQAVAATPPYATTSVRTGNFSVLMGSAGLKAQLGRNLLLTLNGLFQLNDDGLRSKFVPMAGLSYTF